MHLSRQLLSFCQREVFSKILLIQITKIVTMFSQKLFKGIPIRVTLQYNTAIQHNTWYIYKCQVHHIHIDTLTLMYLNKPHFFSSFSLLYSLTSHWWNFLGTSIPPRCICFMWTSVSVIHILCVWGKLYLIRQVFLHWKNLCWRIAPQIFQWAFFFRSKFDLYNL